MCVFRVNVARLCGLNAAVIAEYLWQLYNNDMVKDAVKVLRDNNIIRKGCFNENKFDHTNWYTFTDFGMKVMEANVI